MNIGENLRFFRKKQNLSQKELAEKMHVSERTIGHYETNTRIPTLDMLEGIGKLLGVHVNDFLSDIPREEYLVMEHAQVLFHAENSLAEFALVPLEEANLNPFNTFVEARVQHKLLYFSTKNVWSLININGVFGEEDEQRFIVYDGVKIPFLPAYSFAKNTYCVVLKRSDEYVAIGVDEFISTVDYMDIFPKKNPIREALKPVFSALNLACLHVSIWAARVNSEELSLLAEDIKELCRLMQEDFSLSLIEMKTEFVLQAVKDLLQSGKIDAYNQELQRKKSDVVDSIDLNPLSMHLFEAFSILVVSKK